VAKHKALNWMSRLGGIQRVLSKGRTPLVGQVRLGDLCSARPIDANFGYGRGTPIDRYYIENFLQRCSADIRGRALEVGDASYCERFGTGITHQDVLHLSADNPSATIVGDLSKANVLPDGVFDCIVLTQTLHFIYEMRAALQQLFAALKPGGTALVTFPGITSIDRGESRARWYWSLTHQSAAHLFNDVFGQANFDIAVHGNVYAATTFLQGLALEEVDKAKLDIFDAAYPVIIAVRAVRPE
jgi:SAM-dependent methyltransferase